VRFNIYGYAIPNPILFKNTNFDYFYLLNGAKQLAQIFFSHDLYFIIILIALLWLLIRPNLKEQSMKSQRVKLNALFNLCGVTTLFILPYFIGGGDWFPISWNRYALPLNLILLITFLVMIFEFWKGRNSKLVKTSVLASMAVFFVINYLLVGQFNSSYYLSHALTVTSQSKGSQIFVGGNWIRIDRFANLGQFLNQSLPLDATVASGEEATIMYFSKREMIGLLGVSNPEITAMPFQPLSPGNIHHRRRAYASIYHLRPDVIALNDPDKLGDFSDPYSRLEKVHQVIQNDLFQQYYVDKNYYLVGSFDALKKMGYHHLTLIFDDRVFSLFINDRIYQQFIHNIKAQGFSDAGVDEIKYHVDPAITKRFVPAVESLMMKL
jgi:hypothetical protein